MLNLKKTAVAVLAFGSSAVFAGTMGPVCAPGNVTVPCEMNAWELGAQALYLQPALSNDHAFAGFTDAGAFRRYSDFDPRWGWGFQIEGAYHFNTGNDFNINWYHYSKTTNRTFTSDALLAAPTVFGSRIKPQWDAVNFEFGQHVDFGEFKSIRFHYGAQYARVKTRRGVAYAEPTVVTAPFFDNETMTYNGFGPRVGTDATYGFGNGFAIYGKAAAAVLVGSSKFSGSTFDAAIPPAVPFSYGGSRTAIVPELEAKLGANYTYAMAQGDVTLDVGYMWFDYLSGPQHGVQLHSRTASLGDSDFGMSGLYFGLKWVGNIA